MEEFNPEVHFDRDVNFFLIALMRIIITLQHFALPAFSPGGQVEVMDIRV